MAFKRVIVINILISLIFYCGSSVAVEGPPKVNLQPVSAVENDSVPTNANGNMNTNTDQSIVSSSKIPDGIPVNEFTADGKGTSLNPSIPTGSTVDSHSQQSGNETNGAPDLNPLKPAVTSSPPSVSDATTPKTPTTEHTVPPTTSTDSSTGHSPNVTSTETPKSSATITTSAVLFVVFSVLASLL